MAIMCSDWLDTLVKPMNSELYMKELKMPDIGSYKKKMGYTDNMVHDYVNNKKEVTVYTAYVGMKVKLKDNIALKYDCYGMGEIIQISGEFNGIELHSHHCVVKVDTTGIELILNIGYDNEFDLLSVNDSNVVTIKNAKAGAEVIRKNSYSAVGKIIRFMSNIKNCLVEFDNVQYNVSIGQNGKYDLIFNSKIKKDGTERSNDKHTQESIKVQRFNSKIREGNRERGFIVQCRASRAKCEGYNIQNKESIIKSKKRTKCIA